MAGAAVAGAACVAGAAAAPTGGRLRGVGAGSSVGSGKLVTVSALSHPPLGGSSCQRATFGAGAAGFSAPAGAACAFAAFAGAAGARGAVAGATAGGRGDCTFGAATGTGGATRGGLGAVGEVGACGLVTPAGRPGAAPGRASRDSLTTQASLILEHCATDMTSESASAPSSRCCSAPLPYLPGDFVKVALDGGARVASKRARRVDDSHQRVET